MSTADIPSSVTNNPVSLGQRLRAPGLILVSSVASIGLAIYAGIRLTEPSPAAAVMATPPPKVTVAPVEEQTVTDYRELLGRVDAIETVEIRPRVSGHIEQV